MSIQLINKTYCPYVGEERCEFICDTDADFENLPEACTGSTATSIESGKTMQVNTKGEWVLVAAWMWEE